LTPNHGPKFAIWDKLGWPQIITDYDWLNKINAKFSDGSPDPASKGIKKPRSEWTKEDWAKFTPEEQRTMRLEESSCRILELLWARHPQNEAYNPNSSD